MIFSVFLASVSGIFCYVMVIYNRKGPLQNSVIFFVRSGMSLQEISRELFYNKIIDDPNIFRYVTQFYLGNKTLKAGEYEIQAYSSMSKIVEKMEMGKNFFHLISFPEGLTVKQIFKRLKEDPFLIGDLPSELPREGSLRPDVYKFSWGTRRTEIVEQAILAQRKLIDEIWNSREVNHPIKNKEDFVILSSIVEKETSRFEERAHVASVFINRLSRGMRLQS
ncbi:endolytic transglycosylase MltG, partial [Candidatus Liberibacter sp.]|uniref:endolytic transglycosylase MltG n=1 Tax=Candidatus Liberibacter sp. TaxID=34022 RepID=UPI0015F38BC2